jgi:hypothetical protein
MAATLDPDMTFARRAKPSVIAADNPDMTLMPVPYVQH